MVFKTRFRCIYGCKIKKATVVVAFALPTKGKFALKNSVLIIELKSSPN